jgi:hypothetical protein
MIIKHLVLKQALLGIFLFMLIPSLPLQAQYAYKEGQVIFEGQKADEINAVNMSDEAVVDERLPWIPVLSPAMICMDCWITKTLKIASFYQQQAAQEYFARSETCADMILCPDPRVGCALGYSLLSPYYALRPQALVRNCNAFGLPGTYGVPEPLPSVSTGAATAPQVLTGGSSNQSVQPLLQPMPAAQLPDPAVQATPEDLSNTASAPQGSMASSTTNWNAMSDADILSHFGLDASVATALPKVDIDKTLSEPVVPSQSWETPEESQTQSAVTLLAQANPPQPTVDPSSSIPADLAPGQVIQGESGPMIITSVKPFEKETTQPAESKTTVEETDVEESDTDSDQKTDAFFSVTDDEYKKMREIEKDLMKD